MTDPNAIIKLIEIVHSRVNDCFTAIFLVMIMILYHHIFKK